MMCLKGAQHDVFEGGPAWCVWLASSTTVSCMPHCLWPTRGSLAHSRDAKRIPDAQTSSCLQHMQVQSRLDAGWKLTFIPVNNQQQTALTCGSAENRLLWKQELPGILLAKHKLECIIIITIVTVVKCCCECTYWCTCALFLLAILKCSTCLAGCNKKACSLQQSEH